MGQILEIDSFFTGTRLKNYTREIHWRDTTNYAAALNDDNDFYFDDEQFDRKNLYFCVMNQQGGYVIKDGFADFVEASDRA